MFSQEVAELAGIVWDYHKLNQPLEKADVMLVLGSHDLRVPRYAAQLFHEGYAPRVCISGGVAHHDDLLKTSWTITEAEMFSRVMQEHGVPASAILLEKLAKNTGENFALSAVILKSLAVSFRSVLAVTKPYMERRAFATGCKQWPDVYLRVTSPPGTFEAYFIAYEGQETSPESILHIMVGDLQRIDIYANKGFQTHQEIPGNVRLAFTRLKELGYTKHLLKE